jgi:hypothetical protein
MSDSLSIQPDSTTAPKPKRRRRVFLWVFLAIQVIFLIWIIAGVHGATTAPTDCGVLDAQTCQSATDAGAAIGAGLIIGLWVAVDIIVGGSYAVYRLSTRNRTA